MDDDVAPARLSCPEPLCHYVTPLRKPNGELIRKPKMALGQHRSKMHGIGAPAPQSRGSFASDENVMVVVATQPITEHLAGELDDAPDPGEHTLVIRFTDDEWITLGAVAYLMGCERFELAEQWLATRIATVAALPKVAAVRSHLAP